MEIDDERHRREEAERRAKRKAAKVSKSDSQREKDRKRREHAQRVLQNQKQAKKPRLSSEAPSPAADSSVFESLFAQRAQGFQMEFAFRNAPPRPPVGPCFVGLGLEGKLQDCSHYQPLHSHVWRLHSEPDLGVPLAPSAMDLSCYHEKKNPEEQEIFHPDDEALLNWKGSLGDTAAEQLKMRQDKARAAARLALAGHKLPPITPNAAAAATATGPSSSSLQKRKKEFSRVLDETMQSWMKKTTYLSNDYSRKVHDFTSLAETKQKAALELEEKQLRMDQQRSAAVIAKTFRAALSQSMDSSADSLRHPTKPQLQPVDVLPLLPNVQHWAEAYTHVVLDNPPKKSENTDQQQSQQEDEEEKKMMQSLQRAFVAHVEKREATARRSCQLLVPREESQDNDYKVLQQYDLDVHPLIKDADAPHANFVLWMNEREVTYLPIPSRVQLFTGRPPKKQQTGNVISRRPMSQEEREDMQERLAEVDMDEAAASNNKHDKMMRRDVMNGNDNGAASASSFAPLQTDDDDDAENMEDDDDDDVRETFGTSRTIVAEG